MTSCLLWFQKMGGRVREARLNSLRKFAVAVAVVQPFEEKFASKARFDLVVVDSCT